MIGFRTTSQRCKGMISLEAAAGIALLLVVMGFAVRNGVRLFHHVQLEDSASRLIRVAARADVSPPFPHRKTEAFYNEDGRAVGTAEFLWKKNSVSLVLTLESGLTAKREWPRNDL